MNTTALQTNAPTDGSDQCLSPGTELLHGQYVIKSFLNSGGFGMTYLARDSLDRTVVIKECFPGSLCSRNDAAVRARSRSQQNEFDSIVRHFVQEARRLSKLSHANIVGVHQVFEDNETAYMALDYVDGQDLLDIVDEGKRHLSPTQIKKILLKILEAVAYIHGENILHRDISPDNILLDKQGNPVLIDFGAAREKASKASRALSTLLVVKDGYSPQEFYVSGGVHSPTSDLYALAATFYHLITGKAPPNSQQRLVAIAAKEPDPYLPLETLASGYDDEFLTAIDKTMSVFAKQRIQTAEEWMIVIDQTKRTEALLAQASNDTSTELAISRLMNESNQADQQNQKSDSPIKVARIEDAIQMNSTTPKTPVTHYKQPVEKTPLPQEDIQLETTIDENGDVTGQALDEDQALTQQDYMLPGNPLPLEEPGLRRAISRQLSRRFWFFGKSRTEHHGKAPQ